MESGEIVRALNNGTMPLTLTYSSRDYVLHPDREVAIPFDCMVSYFGDPRARKEIYSTRDSFGIVTWIPDRDTEVRRLRVKWGLYNGDARFIPLQIPVTFMDFEGNRIQTVVDDPMGDSVNTQPQTVSEVSLLTSQLIALQARLDQVEANSRPVITPVDSAINESSNDPAATFPSLTDQAAAVYTDTTTNAAAPSAADIPVDDSTSTRSGNVSAQAMTMTDTTGNKVKLMFDPDNLPNV